MKERYRLKRKYGIYDYILIPLKISPICTVVLIINNLIKYLRPAIEVLVFAGFIDTSVAIYQGKNIQKSIYIYIGLIMLLIAYGYLNEGVLTYVRSKRNIKIKNVYKSAVVEKCSKLKYYHIENDSTWDIINRVCNNPDERIIEGFNNINNSIGIVINVLSLLMIIMAHIWWIGGVILLVCIPLFIVAIKAGEENYSSNVESDNIMRRAVYLDKVLLDRNGVEERNLFGYSEAVQKWWIDKYEIARLIRKKTQIKNYVRMKAGSIITMFIALFIIGMLLIPVLNQKMSVGVFISLVSASLSLVQEMSWNLTNNIRGLTMNKEYLKDFTEFCKLEDQEDALVQKENQQKITFESLEFKNVSFAYPGTEEYILKNFSLTLKKGVHYAFVGKNGCGKTTLTKLICGLYDNYSGEILLNGKNIKEYNLGYLKAMYSIIYQDFAKYQLPIIESILLCDSDREKNTLSKIDNILAELDMKEKIDKLSDGIDTWLGKLKEDGTDLSGGEWQKIAIARALFKDSPLYILDEPTAALDPSAEVKLYSLFAKISENKTTIFITHRLGAAKISDEIIVIDDGKVIESGTHDELMKYQGEYAKMFNEQRSWYL